MLATLRRFASTGASNASAATGRTRFESVALLRPALAAELAHMVDRLLRSAFAWWRHDLSRRQRLIQDLGHKVEQPTRDHSHNNAAGVRSVPVREEQGPRHSGAG